MSNLEKELTKKQNQTPALRFQGFAGEWVQNKFGDLVLIQRGGSPRPIEAFLTQSADGINWVKIGDVSPGSRYINKTKEKIKPEGVNSSRQVFKGDLILSNSMSFGRPYIMNIDGCIHDGWLLIRNDKNIFDLEFLLQLLSSEKMLSQYRELASGGVVNNLNSALVQSTIMVYPKKAEQQKIGSFFQQLDTNLAQHQTQLEKLKNLKQAMLQKMFPQNGATEPEIRFKGFSENWKKVFLNDAAIIAKGQALSSRNLVDGIYPVIAGGKTSPYSHNQYTHEQVITVSASGAYAGFVAYHPNKIWASDCSTLQPKNNNNPLYLFYVLIGLQPLIYSLQTGGAQPHVYPTDLAGLQIFLPTDKKEQKKIGNYFRKLDQLITLQTTQIKKLQQIKQACLVGMFV